MEENRFEFVDKTQIKFPEKFRPNILRASQAVQF